MKYLRMKYVIVECPMGAYLPFVFAEIVEHAAVAQAFARQLNEGEKWSDIVPGAGFCVIADGVFHCFGESRGLAVKSRGDEDSKFLNKYLGVTEVY